MSIGATGRGKRHADDFPEIGVEDYVRAVRKAERTEKASNVAVIVASGTILDGTQPAGSIGGDSLAELIRQAEDDDSVKALVLRVDSGGGSAFASDVILDELQAFQELEAAARRVDGQRRGVRAATGYRWPPTRSGRARRRSRARSASARRSRRSSACSTRSECTSTASATTPITGTFDPLQPMNDAAKGVIAESIRHTYREFVGKVAEHRKKSYDEVDASARGRVWVGSEALDRGLVDKLGNLDDAIASAAELAGLEKGAYGIEHIEPQLGLSEQLALQFAMAAAARDESAELGAAAGRTRSRVGSRPRCQPLAFLERWNDPRGVYAYCFCDTH